MTRRIIEPIGGWQHVDDMPSDIPGLPTVTRKPCTQSSCSVCHAEAESQVLVDGEPFAFDCGAFECRQEIDQDADRWANAPGEAFP